MPPRVVHVHVQAAGAVARRGAVAVLAPGRPPRLPPRGRLVARVAVPVRRRHALGARIQVVRRDAGPERGPVGAVGGAVAAALAAPVLPLAAAERRRRGVRASRVAAALAEPPPRVVGDGVRVSEEDGPRARDRVLEEASRRLLPVGEPPARGPVLVAGRVAAVLVVVVAPRVDAPVAPGQA